MPNPPVPTSERRERNVAKYRVTYGATVLRGTAFAYDDFTVDAELIVRGGEYRVIRALVEKHQPEFSDVRRVEVLTPTGWSARRWMVPRPLSDIAAMIDDPADYQLPETWPNA